MQIVVFFLQYQNELDFSRSDIFKADPRVTIKPQLVPTDTMLLTLVLVLLDKAGFFIIRHKIVLLQKCLIRSEI